MQVGKFHIGRTELADVTPSDARGVGRNEIGVAGSSLVLGFGAEAEIADKYKAADYIKMRQTDGTVSSLYNILTLPILSTGYSFIADDQDAGSQVLDFVRDNLTKPPHRGGMEVPLDLKLAEWVGAVLTGYHLDEKVFELKDGRIVYKKLASRDVTSIKLRRDATGGYDGATQAVPGRTELVVLPAWKTFLFTYGKDKNYLYGESAFRAAAYHYGIKHKLYHLHQLAVQRGAVPPGIATVDKTQVNDEQSKSFMSALQQFGNIRTYLKKPKGIDFEPYNSAMGFIDPLPGIDHHNGEMARSILAQFLMLGSASKGATGSYALSESHSDMFMLSLKGLMQNIENHINFYVIPDLVDLNFGNGAYPVFRFDDMTTDAKQTVKEAFITLLKAGTVSDALVQGIQDRMADSLEIDVEGIQKQLDKAKAKAEKESAANPVPPTPLVVAAPPKEGGPDPKAPASVTDGGTGLSRLRSAESTLLAFRRDWMG